MSTFFHGDSIKVHRVHRWVFANETTRLAKIPSDATTPITFTQKDVGKECFQLSDKTFWRISEVNQGQATWLLSVGQESTSLLSEQKLTINIEESVDVTFDSFRRDQYRSAKYVIQAKSANFLQFTEFYVTFHGSNVYVSQVVNLGNKLDLLNLDATIETINGNSCISSKVTLVTSDQMTENSINLTYTISRLSIEV